MFNKGICKKKNKNKKITALFKCKNISNVKIRGVYKRSTYSGIHLTKNNKLVLRCASSFKAKLKFFRERMIPLSGQMLLITP